MLKRLIEVALPLKEVSEQSAREKSIRHGHISTLHIWWARRPLAACRAVVFASLIPDPDDPECPESFRKLVMETLGRNEFVPKNGNGSAVEDTPRNRCLEFIKHLVRWENSNKPEYIEPARTLIAAAHKFLHPDAEGDAPKVLDPFAGGGAIPLEALRLGCEAHAIDINPVAHLIELCTLVYPQKYGQPDSRPVPEYIKRLVTHNRAKKEEKGQGRPLFDAQEADEPPAAMAEGEIIPDVEITEDEYRKNPLAADVKYWGHWVLANAQLQIGRFYPSDADGGVPLAYFWARTVKCPNPGCAAQIPLVRQLWLCKKKKRRVALRIVPDAATKICRFLIAENQNIDFDGNTGTMQHGQAACPFCRTTVAGSELRLASKAAQMGQQMIAVVTAKPGEKGKRYRPAIDADEMTYRQAEQELKVAKRQYGDSIVPDEKMTPDRPSPNSRGLSAVVRYGFDNFGTLFNPRQTLTLTTFARYVRPALERLGGYAEHEYIAAVGAFLGCVHDRLADKAGNVCVWHSPGEKLEHVFGRQAIPMVWDYGEVNPFSGMMGDWLSGLDWVHKSLIGNSMFSSQSICHRASATALPIADVTLDLKQANTDG